MTIPGRVPTGSIVRGKFPFSGEATVKVRPCLVLAGWDLNSDARDLLLCMMSSQIPRDPYALELDRDLDFERLDWPTAAPRVFVRPTYLFAGAEARFSEVRGVLTDPALQRVLATLRGIL